MRQAVAKIQRYIRKYTDDTFLGQWLTLENNSVQNGLIINNTLAGAIPVLDFQLSGVSAAFIYVDSANSNILTTNCQSQRYLLNQDSTFVCDVENPNTGTGALAGLRAIHDGTHYIEFFARSTGNTATLAGLTLGSKCQQTFQTDSGTLFGNYQNVPIWFIQNSQIQMKLNNGSLGIGTGDVSFDGKLNITGSNVQMVIDANTGTDPQLLFYINRAQIGKQYSDATDSNTMKFEGGSTASQLELRPNFSTVIGGSGIASGSNSCSISAYKGYVTGDFSFQFARETTLSGNYAVLFALTDMDQQVISRSNDFNIVSDSEHTDLWLDNYGGNDTRIFFADNGSADACIGVDETDGFLHLSKSDVGSGQSITIDTTNKRVGIDHITPDHPLTVQSNSGANSIKIIGRSGDEGQLLFTNNAETNFNSYIQGNGTWIRSRADGGHHFKNGGTPSTASTDFTIEGMQLIVGDTTNNLTVKTDGEIELNGTGRVKVPIKIFTSAEMQRGATPPSSAILGNFSFEQYTINDDSVLNLAVLSARDEGTDIEIVIRWAIDEAYATNSAEVQWQVEWSAVPDDGSEQLDNPTHFGTVKSGDINIPATAKTIQETTITIPGTNILNSDEFGFTLKRVALDGGNNPSVEPGIVIVGVLVINDKLGEPL